MFVKMKSIKDITSFVENELRKAQMDQSINWQVASIITEKQNPKLHEILQKAISAKKALKNRKLIHLVKKDKTYECL